MTSKFLKISVSALALSVMAGSALAGGYSRGAANLDPLFEEGTYISTTAGVTSPSRGIDTVNGVAAGPAVGVVYSETFANISTTAAFDVPGNVRCAGSFAQPYGAAADYGSSRLLSGLSTTTSTSLESVEFGLTCGYKAAVGPGNVHLLGGLFYQSLDYAEARAFGFGSPFGGGDIAMSAAAIGYRVGVGYTIPELAVKATLMYRSQVDHTLEGIVRNPAFPTPGNSVTAFADASTPQSVKLGLQSGVAPGWLVFGSVEWTDWSVLQQVQVFANPGQLAPIAVPLAGVTVDAYFKDGWTVNAGVGHKFNEQFSGSFSVTWDSGVSQQRAGVQSGYSDTWTFALGGAFNPNPNASLRAGLAYSVLTSAVERTSGGALLGFGSDHAISGGLSANFKF